MIDIESITNQIINADCMDILKQLPDKCIDLVVTSPPYNLNIEYNSYSDNLPYTEYLEWCNSWINECIRVLKSSGRIAINIPLETNLGGKKFIVSDYHNILKDKLIETAFILWDKQNVTSRTAWGSFCSPSNPNIIQPMECVLVYSKEGRKKEGNKDFIDITKEAFIENSLGVWKIQPETQNRLHPAPYPVELPERIMQMFSYVDDLILDCFSGSGTTAVACHNLKRRFICIEKDYDYWKASVERLENAQAQLKLF